MSEEKFFTTSEVAEILGVHRRTVDRMCQRRQIKYLRITPRRIVIAESWLKEYLEGQTVAPINENEKENENNE